MRITQHNNCFVIRCSPHEMEILGIAVDSIEAGDPADSLPTTGLRRSWARRTNNGPFLRVDRDRRTDHVDF